MTNIVEVKKLDRVIFYYDDGTHGTAYFSDDEDTTWTQNGGTLMEPEVLYTMREELKRQGYL